MNWLKKIVDLKEGSICFKMMLMFLLLVAAKPVSDEGNEYNIKAMFVYNFTKYIDWPSSGNTKIFRIGIVGKSELFGALESIASQKKINDKPIEVNKIAEQDNLSYQIVFIAKTEASKMEELSKKYAGKGVLIISEEYKHTERGVAINLVTTDNKVRFEINQTAARNAGLKISSALINLAVVVNP